MNKEYIAKRNNLYRSWTQEEIEKLPIDPEVRKQLELQLNDNPTYVGKDAVSILGKRAIANISKAD